LTEIGFSVDEVGLWSGLIFRFVALASCRPANRLICKEFAEAIRRHKTSSSKNAFHPNGIAPQSSGLQHECGASLGMFPHVGE
jgi:hypothetical protein